MTPRDLALLAATLIVLGLALIAFALSGEDGRALVRDLWGRR